MKRPRGRPVTTRGFPSVHIRIPPDMYKQIVKSAKKDHRSINNEIVVRLLKAYRRTK